MATRILAGKWRSRVIQVPKGDRVRPTTSRVRQSVLERFTPFLSGARVLDGFAGSGVIGLECLSRGAAFVQAVEKHPHHARVIEQNLHHLTVEPDEYQLHIGNLEQFIDRSASKAFVPFDLIYLDPPYGYSGLNALIELFSTSTWLSPQGILLVESDRDSVLPPPCQSWSYGDTRVLHYSPL